MTAVGCSNESCDRPLPSTVGRRRFCSDVCRAAARNPGGWVTVSAPIPMRMWHLLDGEARRDDLPMEYLVYEALDNAVFDQ